MAGPEKVPSDPAGSAPAGPTLGRAHILWLGALALLGTLLVLEPLGSFALFGSDTGEYYRLTTDLVSSGRLPTSGYAGWGSAYPDFPGIFLLSGAVAGALRVDTLSALIVGVPVVAALAVVPLFLLFRRLLPNPTLALLGAGFASVFMPRLFSVAHPAPLSLGDFLAVAGLWLFVEGRRESRFYLPLALVSGALIVTHHLSSYFFLVSATGGFVLLEIWRPGSWSRRFPLRELLFLAGFTVVLLAYWFLYSPQFVGILQTGLPVQSLLVVPLGPGSILGFAVLGLLVRWRRSRSRSTASFRYPTTRSVLRDMAIILGGVLLGVAAVTFVPLPGTTQTAATGALVWFVPVFVAIALTAGTRRLMTASRLGPFALVWLVALGLATLLALVAENPELPASRHVEYLLLPVGLLVAVGIGHLVGRWVTPAGRPAVAAAGMAAVLLLAANAAIAYPPPMDFGGFQEGLTFQDAALWLWVGVGLPEWATVATDHRLSSMVFGFDGNPATWDSTVHLFTGTTWSGAAGDLSMSDAPHTKRPVNAVAVDETMRTGVALDPGALASPMSAEALQWFGEPPFVPLYENGPQVVYWVNGPIPAVP